MPSFQRTVCAMSMLGSRGCPAASQMGLVARSVNALRGVDQRLDGMQPMFRQVPPRLSPSTSTVETPGW